MAKIRTNSGSTTHHHGDCYFYFIYDLDMRADARRQGRGGAIEAKTKRLGSSCGNLRASWKPGDSLSWAPQSRTAGREQDRVGENALEWAKTILFLNGRDGGNKTAAAQAGNTTHNEHWEFGTSRVFRSPWRAMIAVGCSAAGPGVMSRPRCFVLCWC